MKIFKYGIAGFLLLLLSYCQPPVVFTEPQPRDEPELSRIPMEYQGMYWCEVDSIALIIDEKMISKQKEYESKLSMAEIESNPNLSFQNETLYSKELNQAFPAKLIGETIISQITLKDTLFSKTTEQVLKFYKGHLILNNPIDNDNWEVTIISLKYPDILSLTKANLPDNLDELERITAVEKFKTDDNEKTVQIKISPTKAEFDQILGQGLIFDGSCIDFKRVFPITEMAL
ncbi:MAG: hypothetical protein WBA61_09920 [Aequorivita sp.]